MSIHINVTLIGCGVCSGAAETRVDYLVTSIPMEGVFSREFGEQPGTTKPREGHEKSPSNNCDTVLVNDSFNDSYMSIQYTSLCDSSLQQDSLARRQTTDVRLQTGQ